LWVAGRDVFDGAVLAVGLDGLEDAEPESGSAGQFEFEFTTPDLFVYAPTTLASGFGDIWTSGLNSM